MVWALMWREIRYRFWGFFAAAVAVGVVVGCMVAIVLAMRANDAAQEAAIVCTAEDTEQRLGNMDAALRKNTLVQQFNVTILPKEQDVSKFLLDGCPDTTMAVETAEKLLGANFSIINHIEPSLSQRIAWPEKGRDILVVGARAEQKGAQQKFFNEPVERGEVSLGNKLGEGLRVGDMVKMFGREFKLVRVLWPRGTVEDLTSRFYLEDAQDFLGLPGRINAIKAVNCGCSMEDLLAIEGKICALLPSVQVVFDRPKAEMRTGVLTASRQETAEATAAQEQAAKNTRERLQAASTSLLPAVALVCVGWLFWVLWSAVHARRSEIAVLRSIGAGGAEIAALFLGKAFFIGLVGAVLGWTVAIAGVWKWCREIFSDFAGFWDLQILSIALGAGITLALLAAFIPTLHAVLTRPADILQNNP